MYERNIKSVMSHVLGPPMSQTVTPSWNPSSPSSVTYFMDGPN